MVPAIEFADGTYSFNIANKQEIGFFSIGIYYTGGGSHSDLIVSTPTALSHTIRAEVDRNP